MTVAVFAKETYMENIVGLVIVIWLVPLATGLFKKQVLIGIAGSVASWIGSSMILRVIKTILNRDIPKEDAAIVLILASIVVSSVFVYFILKKSGTSPHS